LHNEMHIRVEGRRSTQQIRHKKDRQHQLYFEGINRIIPITTRYQKLNHSNNRTKPLLF